MRKKHIIDYSEVFIERPSSFFACAMTDPSYKGHNTENFFFFYSISSTGAIINISTCWGGSVSDRYLTDHSDFCKHLIHGDLRVAD